MDNDKVEQDPKKKKKPLKGLQRLYEEPMEDDELLDYFKHDHGISDHYSE